MQICFPCFHELHLGEPKQLQRARLTKGGFSRTERPNASKVGPGETTHPFVPIPLHIESTVNLNQSNPFGNFAEDGRSRLSVPITITKPPFALNMQM